MKVIFIILCMTCIISAQTPSLSLQKTIKTQVVDIKKFSGLWYEIARTYNSFEKDCVAATVEYMLTPDMDYKLINRCFDTVIGGDLIQYNGTAKIVNSNHSNQIKMTYYWFFTSSYNILYLDEDYSSAIIADTEMEHVWIMNREPFMKKEKLNKLVSLLADKLDTSKLIYTPQDSEGQYK